MAAEPHVIHSGILLKGGGLLHKEFTERKVSVKSDGSLTYWHLSTKFKRPDGTIDLSKCSLKAGGKGVVQKAEANGELGVDVTIMRTDVGGQQKHKVGDEVTMHLRAITPAAAREWVTKLDEAMQFSRLCSLPVRKDVSARHGSF